MLNVGIDIDEHRRCAEPGHDFGRGGEGEVGHEHGVARLTPFAISTSASASELQERNVLAFGDRAGELRLHLDDVGLGEPADQIDIVYGKIDDDADVRHPRRKRSNPGDADGKNTSPEIAVRLIAATAGLKRST